MINIEQVDKTSIAPELNEFLNKFVIKHATVPNTLIARTDAVELRNEKCLSFHDPKFPKAEPVGYVAWTRGSRSPREYLVYSRLIDNAKHRWDRVESNSLRSKELNKSVKTAMTALLPWDMSEFAHKSVDNASRFHSRWVDEISDVQYAFRLGSDVMADELEHLLNSGIEFKNPEVKTAVENLAKYKEWKRRRGVGNRALECVVMVDSNIGLVKRDNGGVLADAIVLESYDQLPEKHKANISLLKVIGEDNKFVPNVGYRANDHLFWVYSEDVV